ncbi:MAG: CAP domain-containing protein [Treponema sp.]|jgi:uncharacterized protein YkwD|nr:CAP domain-containing protein [Treponema sp.]
MNKLFYLIMMFYCSMIFSCESLEEIPADGAKPGINEVSITETPDIGQKENTATVLIPGRGATPIMNQNRRSNSTDPDWDTTVLDTAKDAYYLSRIEKSVILEMNKARTNPKKYAEMYIQPELRYYNGKLYQRPNRTRIQTYEGAKALEDCIAALSNMEPVPLLMPELGLSLGARDLAYEQERTGQTGHDGSDGSTPFTRIRRYGGGYIEAAENLYYGAERAREVVVQLLIDDGTPSKGHRANILNKDFSQAGVSFDSHPNYETVCVITFARGYVSN